MKSGLFSKPIFYVLLLLLVIGLLGPASKMEGFEGSGSFDKVKFALSFAQASVIFGLFGLVFLPQDSLKICSI